MARETPYGAFNFLVKFNGNEEFGGFSDVSGLGTEFNIAEYRTGNYRENHVRKIPGTHKVSDITLKRGIVDPKKLLEWVKEVRTASVNAKRTISITLQDENHKDVYTWTLREVVPMKYTGPTFAAKGGGDVAMEELVLSAEALDFG
jgi:phage tail-like protein